MLGISIIIALVAGILFAFPAWPYSRRWSYYPAGGLVFMLAVVVLFLLFTPRL